jgi:hypothetical protein
MAVLAALAGRDDLYFIPRFENRPGAAASWHEIAVQRRCHLLSGISALVEKLRQRSRTRLPPLAVDDDRQQIRTSVGLLRHSATPMRLRSRIY